LDPKCVYAEVQYDPTTGKFLGRVTDEHLFRAIDDWVQGQLDDFTFLSVVDAWARQLTFPCGQSISNVPVVPNESIVQAEVLRYSILNSQLIDVQPEQTLYSLFIHVLTSVPGSQPASLVSAGQRLEAFSKDPLSPDLYGKEIRAKVRLRGDEWGRRYWVSEIQILSPLKDKITGPEEDPLAKFTQIVPNASRVTGDVLRFSIWNPELLGIQRRTSLYSLTMDILASEPVDPALSSLVRAGERLEAFSVEALSPILYGKRIRGVVERGVMDDGRRIAWIREVLLVQSHQPE